MSKIYTQHISGKYRTIKNHTGIALLLFYFLTPWIRWGRVGSAPDQAILIDLPTRRAYFFGIEIWPEEIFYITAILVLAAFGLFLFTSIFGRIWCGYTCPHTVFVDMFIKIENFFQGDRNTRVFKDKQPMTLSALRTKFLTHCSWLVLSFCFAFGWVCYFYNAPEFAHDLFFGSIGVASKAWLFGLTFATYIFAGFIRERVCMYMCPYGRFQSAMLDNDSLVVTYHDWRGEPRVEKNTEIKNFGDCINCNKCVIVCPMGIDIRDGLQMECIGCGLCIDACDSVMKVINKPTGLISYSSANAVNQLKKGIKQKVKLIRPKIVLYSLLMITASLIILKSLIGKSEFVLLVERERGPLFTITPDGDIRNTYSIYIANKALVSNKICLKTEGVTGVLMKGNELKDEYKQELCFSLDADSENRFKLFLKIKSEDVIATSANNNEEKLTFIFHNHKDNKIKILNSVFITPSSNYK